MAEMRGIGCEYCDGTGVIQQGSGHTYIAGGDVNEDWYDVPCPMCSPPDEPDSEPEDGDYYEAEVW